MFRGGHYYLIFDAGPCVDWELTEHFHRSGWVKVECPCCNFVQMRADPEDQFRPGEVFECINCSSNVEVPEFSRAS